VLTILGLPIHPLIVHATVVAVPAAAIAVALAAIWPRFRRWASWGTPALAVVALVLVPLTTSSGESLEHQLPRTALIERHSHLADGLLPWAIGLLVTAVAGFWLTGLAGRFGPRRRLPGWLPAVVTVLALVAAIGTLVEVVLIGHSGAAAAWTKGT
jgi:hypothetical protein